LYEAADGHLKCWQRVQTNE